jgi:hypothetical protein
MLWVELLHRFSCRRVPPPPTIVRADIDALSGAMVATQRDQMI